MFPASGVVVGTRDCDVTGAGVLAASVGFGVGVTGDRVGVGVGGAGVLALVVGASGTVVKLTNGVLVVVPGGKVVVCRDVLVVRLGLRVLLIKC